MLPDPGDPQSLAGAHAQGGHCVSSQPQQRGCLGGREALHRRVPEDLLPPRRQGPERSRAEVSLERGEGLLLGIGAVGHQLAVALIEGLLAAAEVRPGGGDVADRREEVGAEGALGTAPAGDGAEHPEERFRDEVIRIGATGEGAGDRTPGQRMTAPEFGCRVRAALADQRHQLGIARSGHGGGFLITDRHGHVAPSGVPRGDSFERSLHRPPPASARSTYRATRPSLLE
nr:hypothetical protein [Rathayibacter iranicus]